MVSPAEMERGHNAASHATARNTESPTVDTTLDPVEVARLRSWCEAGIDARWDAYQPPVEVPTAPPAYHRVVRWRGVERTVWLIFDDPGRELHDLLSWHAVFDPDAGRVHVFGNAGLTRPGGLLLMRLRAGAGT